MLALVVEFLARPEMLTLELCVTMSQSSTQKVSP